MDAETRKRLDDVEERLEQALLELSRLSRAVANLVEQSDSPQSEDDAAPSCDAQGHPDNPPV